jgi:hypothetical protein
LLNLSPCNSINSFAVLFTNVVLIFPIINPPIFLNKLCYHYKYFFCSSLLILNKILNISNT